MTEASIREELDLLWQMLESRTGGTYRTAFISAHVGDRRFSIALDDVGARHLLIPRPSAADVKGLWRNGTLNLSCVNLRGEDGLVRTWLALKCKRFDLADVFMGLAANIVVRLCGWRTEQVQDTTLEILEEWRALLGSGGASDDDICGLLGELLVLKRLVTADATRAWNAWEGHRGGRHDFRFGQKALESKATLRPTAKVVSINGLTQLQEPSEGELHLVFQRFERVPGGSITLCQLFEELVSLGIPRTDFAELWEEAGFPDLDGVSSRAPYELRETAVYKVTPGFPRITPASFQSSEPPPGVDNVKYTTDLSHAVALSPAEADAILYHFL